MCNIWESCRNQATSECLHCEENPLATEPLEDNYEFNHWEDNEE